MSQVMPRHSLNLKDGKRCSVEKKTVLDQGTLIPVGVTVIVFLASMWLTTVYVDGQETKKDVMELKSDVNSRLERIEDKLDRVLTKK